MPLPSDKSQSEAPPTYLEALNEIGGGQMKADETTALNGGDKTGYTPGMANKLQTEYVVAWNS